MRLIDADYFKARIAAATLKFNIAPKKGLALMELVDAQPTFDTDVALEELKQYRSIGRPEECREAVERRYAKKPVKNEHKQDCCPHCGWIVYKDEYGGIYFPCCENCGQVIDWSKEVKE